MDTLYPNLYERFKTEGLCPICFMEMDLMPRYSCVNGHNLCHRCKPYYYGCPKCSALLDVEILLPQNAPQPVHSMPHPTTSHWDDHGPSAPSMNDFLNHERRAWESPMPAENRHLESCSYSHLGCWVKIPEQLRTLHESRCLFRPHSEEEHAPTDLHRGHDDLVDCSYFPAGCKVRTVPWRRSIHEKHCIYKDRMLRCQDVNDISEGLASATIADNGGDPEELVQCKFRRYGCMVNMPRRRKYIHEQKCNYKSHHRDIDDDFDYPSQPELDPDEQVECRWSEYGCRVRPKRCRKQIHEDKCNYRMEECMWKHYGCTAIFNPTLRHSHENNCDFAHH